MNNIKEHGEFIEISKDNEKLFTREFIALNALIFLAYCNLAIMFHLESYLKSLPIDPKWIGLLISVFSLSGLVIRPLISPFLHPGNIRRWIFFSAVADIFALVCYSVAHTFLPLLIVRLIHGAAYVCLSSAKMAAVVSFIPSHRSGQAFSITSASMLLPYAIIPAIFSTLTRWFGGFENVLICIGFLMILIFPLLLIVGSIRSPLKLQIPQTRHITYKEFFRNLRNPKVIVPLIFILILFFSLSAVFCYIYSFGKKIGIQNPGFFFTFAILTMICIRFIAGPLFDKMRNSYILAISFAGLVIAFLGLPQVKDSFYFFLIAFICGLCWGAAHPILHTILFKISPPRLQGLNQNLGTEMVDSGFFLGPLLGGLAITALGDYSHLFYLCAGVTLVSLLLIPVFIKLKSLE